MDGAQLCSAGSGSASGKRQVAKASRTSRFLPGSPHRPTTLCILQAKHGRKRGKAGHAGCLSRFPSPAQPALPTSGRTNERSGRTMERIDGRTSGRTKRTDGPVTSPSRLYFSSADVDPFAHGISHSIILAQGSARWAVAYGETIRTLVSWRQVFSHSTRNQCMGWFVLSSGWSFEMINSL